MNRYYQDGGQEGSQEQMQMIMQKVAQMLQQGTQPQQVLSQLVEAGIPQDQAVQLVQGVMQQMQGSQETQGGQEMPQEQFGYGGMRTYQGGAQMPQEQMELPQEVIQILQMFAQMQGMNQEQFQQLVQKFMELSPDEQKDALTQIAQVMQQEEEAEGPQQQMAQQPQQMAQEQMPQEQPQQPVMQGGGRFMTPSEMTKAMSLFNSPADMAQGTQERGVPSMMTMSVSGNPFSKTSLKKYQTGDIVGPTRETMEEADAKSKVLNETKKEETNQQPSQETPVNNQLTFNINDFSKVKTNIERIKSLQNDLKEMADFDESVKSSPVYKAFVKTSFKKNGESDGVWGKNTQALYQLLQSKTRDENSNISNFAEDFKTIKKEANNAVKELRKVQKPQEPKANQISQSNYYEPVNKLSRLYSEPNYLEAATKLEKIYESSPKLQGLEAIGEENAYYDVANSLKNYFNNKTKTVKDVVNMVGVDLGNVNYPTTQKSYELIPIPRKGGLINNQNLDIFSDKLSWDKSTAYQLVKMADGRIMRKYINTNKIDIPSAEDMERVANYLNTIR